MDEIIKKLKTSEECMTFVEIFTKLAVLARMRAIELRVKSHGNISNVEKELYGALYAYEDVLSQKNGRKTHASRTWPMVNKYGIIGAAERAVSRKFDPQGYQLLIAMGLEKLTFESVIVKNPSAFTPDAVNRSKVRLENYRASTSSNDMDFEG